MEIAEIRIDDCHIGHAIHVQSGVSLILQRSMQPGAIDHQVIDGAFARHQACAPRRSSGTSHLQTGKAVKVGAGGELDRAVAPGLHLYLRHHVLRIRATILRAAHQRSNPCIAGCSALPFRRQNAVRSAGSDDDPVVDVAVLGRHHDLAGKGCTRLKLNRVAAVGVVQRRLQIAAGIDADHCSRRGCVSHRTRNGHARQFGGTIEIAPRNDCNAEISGCGVLHGVGDRDREVECAERSRYASKIPGRSHRDSRWSGAGGNAPAVRRSSAGRGEDFTIRRALLPLGKTPAGNLQGRGGIHRVHRGGCAR